MATTMTHSPAPWRYRSDKMGCSDIVDANNEQVVYELAGGDIEPINAALIAAAPELLEACKSVLEAFKNLPINDGWYTEIGLLESAIAKAEPK